VRKDIGGWHVVALDLWYAPGQAREVPANAGFSKALALLERAAKDHPEAVRLMDVSRFAEFERWQIYARHAHKCGFWGYAMAEVFGSRSRAGSHAGTQVPLLSIHFREANAPCAAPHLDAGGNPGAMHSILDVLRMLDPAEQRRLFGGTV
jgi:hypothetical protein